MANGRYTLTSGRQMSFNWGFEKVQTLERMDG